MSQSPILGPMDTSSAPMAWCSTLSRNSYTTLPIPKEASESRNYPMRSGGYVLNPASQQDNRHTSWSTAPKQSSLPIADELTSMDSEKLAVPPSSNQQGTSRVSDATTIATSRNATSTLVILSSAASRTRKDYTSSAHPGKVPS
jgi:hypothetical protein